MTAQKWVFALARQYLSLSPGCPWTRKISSHSFLGVMLGDSHSANRRSLQRLLDGHMMRSRELSYWELGGAGGQDWDFWTLENFCSLALLFGGSDGQESTCEAGDPGSTPWFRKIPGEGNGSPLQYSCLGNPMERGYRP